MTSYSGSVAYLEYQSKTDKGGVKVGDKFNSVFGLGAMSEDRMNFTSQAIAEPVLAAGEITLAWGPIVKGVFYNEGDKQYYDVKVLDVNGEFVTYANVVNGKVTVGQAGKICYKYNQEYTPANDIPTIGPVMKRIPLVAEPRRIAVKYDQITAFQA